MPAVGDALPPAPGLQGLEGGVMGVAKGPGGTQAPDAPRSSGDLGPEAVHHAPVLDGQGVMLKFVSRTATGTDRGE